MEYPQTYKLSEFVTSEWADRLEYATGEICFEHVKKMHMQQDNYLESGQCGNLDFWYFLEVDGLHFKCYLYLVDGYSYYLQEPEKVIGPKDAEPIMVFLGTSFDGVRESSGTRFFTCGLTDFAEVLVWMDQYLRKRWPDIDM